jgi:dTDP-4-amino-4,6-dideoxygalactose transaminase
MPYYKQIGYEGADLSNAEHYYNRCISLPMYPTLTAKEQTVVIENVLAFVK